ncbi:MAG: hypothetical protein A3F18_05210 [Legionellales bacterium RIFCSPHIGHO2_12_FULL_37_14]|nr:MAG: hypothetical protein A3F18_05210 [Legionellales bacterium RIFCSPHIGHO2_12_FULL_37_14]
MFNDLFTKYPAKSAPFLHQQYADWSLTKPLRGLEVLHHVPVVQNTLLKIAILREAGATVTVTNPTFMHPCQQALQILRNEQVPFVADPKDLIGQTFDIYFDCGAELYQTLGPPKKGAIELTESGDTIYRKIKLNFPVVSVDRCLTKQLETVFGTAVSAANSIHKLTGHSPAKLNWMIFGFGKIGRGLAYYCAKSKTSVCIADISKKARLMAQQLFLPTLDANVLPAIYEKLQTTDIVVTATGCKGALSAYPKEWFLHKILANMGALDEFGPGFSATEVLNAKKPLNFILEDPTPIEYIDPELYLHNQAVLDLLNNDLSFRVHNISPALDSSIIDRWCQHHQFLRQEIERWFYDYEKAVSFT